MPVSVADVKAAVADDLRRSVSSLEAYWSGTCERALDKAEADVNSALAARGFSGAQIAGWPGRDSAVLEQALYWALSHGQNREGEGAGPPAERFDQREWLKTVTITDAAGDLVTPATSPVGRGVLKGGWADVSGRDPVRPQGPFVDDTGQFRRW